MNILGKHTKKSGVCRDSLGKNLGEMLKKEE